MRFKQALCPKCGRTASAAQDTTLVTTDLDAFTEDDGGLDFDWSSSGERTNNAEGDEALCISEAKDAVVEAARKLVNGSGLGDVLGVLVIDVEEALAELAEHQKHNCITLHCPDCCEDWHTEIIREETP